VAFAPSVATALGYLGGYFAIRMAIVWMIGIHGLKEKGLWKKMPLIPMWDAMAFVIWLISFARKSVRWRDGEYFIRNGMLVPVTTTK
jgi:hypothetical protein